jgi:hypothetical protein
VDFTDIPFPAADQMLTVDEARERLAVTEPLDFITFYTCEPGIEMHYGKGWPDGELTGISSAWLTVPDGTVYQLSRQCASQVGSVARVNQKYAEWLPPELLSVNVTWALTEGLRKKSGDGVELKILVAGSGRNEEDTEDIPLAVAQTRATVEPFSNVELLNAVLLAVRGTLGDEFADSALVDYKFFHDLEHTSFRVVIPLAQQVIVGTGTEDDAWCFGIEVSNSLIGLKQTTVSGYLFRFATMAGLTDIEHAAGGFSRRGSTPQAAYNWAAEAAEEILGGIGAAFAGLQALPDHIVDGEYASIMDQYFRQSPVSKEIQLRIVTDLEETPVTELNMYDLAAVSAEAANLDGSTWRDVRTVHDLAGFIVHQGGGMCDGSLERGCRRLLPEDWEARAPEDPDAS